MLRRAALAFSACLALSGGALAQSPPAAPAATEVPCFEPNERSLGEYHVISPDLRRVILDGTDRLKPYRGLKPDDLALKTTQVDKDVMIFVYVRRSYGGRTPLCYRDQATLPLKRYLELVGDVVGAPS